MNILGISAFYHDSAACLVHDGAIVSAAQEERFTRKKHDFSFPINAVKFCLSNSGLTAADLDYVSFYDKPFVKFERILETYLAFAPLGLRSFITAIPLWIKQKLWIKDIISRELDYSGPILFPEHHESHAASAFYPSPFQEAAFVTVDGVGEWTTTSYGIGRDNNVDVLAEIHFPHSLGLLYSTFTHYTGFKVNSGEYKVMGLAPYGRPQYKDIILEKLIDIRPDGSFKLNMEYFGYCSGLRMTNKRFEKLFGGPARVPESDMTQREMDLARSVQEVVEEAMLGICRRAHEKTGMKNLVLAGGVALNCVGNGRILREGPFENIWIQPAAGDAGGALGAALFAWYRCLGNKRTADGKSDSQRGSYLGPEFDDDAILEFLRSHDIPYTRFGDEQLCDKVAELLTQENVVGWFRGPMEFGPRALGARSILGDARSPKMQQEINLKIKYRESFRPFAPSVLEQSVSEYFEIDRPSPYMLLVAPVRKKIRRQLSDEEQSLSGFDKLNVVRSDVPAVTHVDFSARIQTVSPMTNPVYYRIIHKFKEKTGCSVVINTSFNVRGEPIVCTPKDAWFCFMRTNMDYLVLGNFLLDKKQQKQLDSDTDSQEQFQLYRESTSLAGTYDNKASNTGELRRYGIVMAAALAAIGSLLLWKGRDYYFLFFAVMASFLVIALAAPIALRPVYKVWMTLAHAMGWVMTRVILFIAFVVLVTPLGLLLRLCGKDLLDIKFDRSQSDSYWRERDLKGAEQRDYEKQF
jgi:carbamoyltransferase